MFHRIYDRPPHHGQPAKTGSTMGCPSLSVVVVTVLEVQSVLVTTSMVNPGGEVVMVSVTGGSRILNRQSGNKSPSHISGSRRGSGIPETGRRTLVMESARCNQGSHCLDIRRVEVPGEWRLTNSLGTSDKM
jgi:hypothetical protein